MRESTLKLTTGAMFIAIFGMLLLLNRQTGGLLEEALIYFLPIPMVAYGAKYGFKASVPVFIAMCLTTIFCSTPTSIFYAITEALLGMCFGVCIYKKVDMTKTLLMVMALSAVFNLLNTIVLASLFGNDLTLQLDMMRQMMNEALSKAFDAMAASNPAMAQQLPDLSRLLTNSYLIRMMIISMGVFGMAQGFLIYTLSLLILRRLRFHFPKPRSIYDFDPPRWTGYVALMLFCVYTYVFSRQLDSQVAVIGETLGIVGYLYLCVFGVLAIALFLRRFIPRSRFLRYGIAFMVFMTMGQLAAIMGFMYIAMKYREPWMQRAEEAAAAADPQPRTMTGRPGTRTEYRTEEKTAEPSSANVPAPSQRTAGTRQSLPGRKSSLSQIARIKTADLSYMDEEQNTEE